MKEIELSIPLNNRLKAYGSFLKQPKSKKLIIIVHGLLNNKDHHLFYNASHFFAKNGYSTWRYNLYGPQKTTRKFGKTNFLTFSKDLEKIIDIFSKTHSEIVLIAHSLGVWNVLNTNQQLIDKVVFWEPSLSPKIIFSSDSIDMGFLIKVPPSFKNSTKELPAEELFSKLKLPTLIVAAERANLSIAKKYTQLITGPKSFKIITGANHTFEQNEDKLFAVTLHWLRKRSLDH